MIVIYLSECNTICYRVTFQNNGCVKVQKFKEISNHENFIFCVKPLEIFFGEGEVFDKTLMSGAFDKSVFDGNTILLEISEENVNKSSYISVEI